MTHWTDHEHFFIKNLHELKVGYSLDTPVFGDIDLQAHRDWEEWVCGVVGLKAVLSLWQQNRKQLVLQMLDSGMKTFIVSFNTTMGFKYLGQQITRELDEEQESIGVDTCGENGEYHTLVTDCKLFKSHITAPFGVKK